MCPVQSRKLGTQRSWASTSLRHQRKGYAKMLKLSKSNCLSVLVGLENLLKLAEAASCLCFVTLPFQFAMFVMGLALLSTLLIIACSRCSLSQRSGMFPLPAIRRSVSNARSRRTLRLLKRRRVFVVRLAWLLMLTLGIFDFNASRIRSCILAIIFRIVPAFYLRWATVHNLFKVKGLSFVFLIIHQSNHQLNHQFYHQYKYQFHHY